MTRGRVFTQLFLLTILLTVLIISPSIPMVTGEDDTDTIVLPINGDNLPVIDGNKSSFSQEWVNASKIYINVGGKEGFNGELYTQVNGTHLFVMLNFTHEYLPVNDTVPAGSQTPYNNATHDWFAFEFDNDLRRNDFGTIDSPHDIVILNEYNTSTVDGFVYMNETDDNPVVVNDLAVGGENNTAGVIGNITTYYDKSTIIEFYKAINSNDTKGHDVNIFDQLIISFRILAWINQTADFNTSTVMTSSWVNYRLNETGTGFAVEPTSNMTAYLDARGASDYDNIKGFVTLIKSYGIQVENVSWISSSMTLDDLRSKNITFLFLGNHEYKDDEIKAYTEYFINGGHLMIFVGTDLSASAKKLLENLYLSTYDTPVLFGDVNQNGTDTYVEDVTTYNTDAPFFKGPSPTTDKEIQSLLLASGALNTTLLNNAKTIQGQRFLAYNIAPIPNTLFLDENNDGIHNENESLPDDSSLILGVDLEFGGRIVVFSTASFVDKLSVQAKDNEYFFIRLVPWAARFTGFLKVNHTTTDKFEYMQGDPIAVFTSVYKNNNDTNTQNVTVEVIFKQADVPLKTIIMTFNNTENYTHYIFTSLTGELEAVKGFVDVYIRAYENGWGFADQSTTILIERIPPIYNQINPVLALLFAVMLIVVVFFAGYAYKKLK